MKYIYIYIYIYSVSGLLIRCLVLVVLKTYFVRRIAFSKGFPTKYQKIYVIVSAFLQDRMY